MKLLLNVLMLLSLVKSEDVAAEDNCDATLRCETGTCCGNIYDFTHEREYPNA